MSRSPLPTVPTAEITDPALYLRRREFLRGAALASAGLALGAGRAGAVEAPRCPR